MAETCELLMRDGAHGLETLSLFKIAVKGARVCDMIRRRDLLDTRHIGSVGGTFSTIAI